MQKFGGLLDTVGERVVLKGCQMALTGGLAKINTVGLWPLINLWIVRMGGER